MVKILLLDNFDSFTYNLVDYLEQLNAEVAVIQNTASIKEIKPGHYDGVLLSPGPETPTKAGNLMQVLDECIGRRPVLGVCLGHQAIGEYFGAKLVRAKKPMHGKISSIKHNSKGVFTNLPNPLKIVRYHSLVLEQLPDELEITAITSTDNEIMGFRHKHMAVEGVQFHPEAYLTEHGLAMLKNWISFIQKEK